MPAHPFSKAVSDPAVTAVPAPAVRQPVLHLAVMFPYVWISSHEIAMP